MNVKTPNREILKSKVAEVLTSFKALFKYNAVNITLGLQYLSLSPDHGTAHDIIGLNKASPQSLINTINFLNKIND